MCSFQYTSSFNESNRTLPRDIITNHSAEKSTGSLRRKGRSQSRDQQRRAGRTEGLNHGPVNVWKLNLRCLH